MRFFYLLIALFFICHFSTAQRLKWQRLQPTKFLEVGFTGNAYNGDLGRPYSQWGSGASISVLFNKKEKLNGSLSLQFKTASGQNISFEPFPENEEGIFPNTYFQSNIIAASYQLRYHFIKTDYIHLYLGQGIGLFGFSSRDIFGEPLQDRLLTRNFDESYTNTSFYLPTSLGCIFLMRNGYGIGFQGTIANLLTDYLDNISQLGNDNGNDNLISLKVACYIPLSFYEKKQRRRNN